MCFEDFQNLSASDWKALYSLAKRQGLTAVVLEKIKPLPKEVAPPRELALKWLSHAMSLEKQAREKYKRCADFALLMHEHGMHTLEYRDKATGNLIDVPYEAFVPFEMKPTYNRIGTVTVEQNGQFELRLRKEYKYDWTTDAVKFQFTGGGVVYEKEFISLNSLYETLNSNTTIILEAQ